jgi:hypothetical protein
MGSSEPSPEADAIESLVGMRSSPRVYDGGARF